MKTTVNVWMCGRMVGERTFFTLTEAQQLKSF